MARQNPLKAQTETPRGGDGTPGGSLGRVVAATLALAVAAAGLVLAWRIVRTTEAPPQQPRDAGMGNALADTEEGFTELPAPPEVRLGAATVWTGSELVVWGGHAFDGSEGPPAGTGFAFDPATGTWADLPQGPLSPRSYPAVAWTGSEFLVWGGWDGTWSGPSSEVPGTLGDGAAYDPEARTWRMLPPAPIGARAPLSVWTGKELLVWGTSIRVPDPPRDGAAYDPARDAWRPIPEAPIELTDATAVWTGREMIVFGAALRGGNFPETETAVGAAYDPAADAWRRIPDSTLSPQASTAAWDGTGMIAWDYLNGTAAYDPSTDSWRGLPRVPSRDYECTPESVGVPGYVLGVYCGQLVVYSAADGVWHNVPDLNGWFVEPVAAEPAIILLARNYTTDQRATFAYRPPATFGCAGMGGADPADRQAARALADAFLMFREDAADLDLAGVMSPSGEAAYEGDKSGLSPLFDDYIDGEVLFVDGPMRPGPGVSPSAVNGASYEVGVRLLTGEEHPVEETVFLSGPARTRSGDLCPLAVTGARPGLTGS